MSSFVIFDSKQRYEIEIVEELNTHNGQNLREQLKKREAYYIMNNICVNKNVPIRTTEEKRRQRNKIQRDYYHRKKQNIVIWDFTTIQKFYKVISIKFDLGYFTFIHYINKVICDFYIPLLLYGVFFGIGGW